MKIKLDSLKEAIELLDKESFLTLEVEIKGLGEYEAEMYRIMTNTIRIDLIEI